MKAMKINKPEFIHEAAVQAVAIPSSYANNNLQSLDEIFAPSFLFYGTAEEEKALNYDDFLKYLGNRKEEASGEPKIDSNPVFHSFSPDGQSAVFVNEVYNAKDKSSSKNFRLRISTTLFKLEQGWRVVHLHISSPAIKESSKENVIQQDLEKRIQSLEKLVKKRTKAFEDTLEALKVNQAQLVKQEKLASLGQLTAGIAHEIKNPLNFINNFSELSSEFLEEIEENIGKLEKSEITEEIKALLEDVKANLIKIHHHGSRADGIVKSMLLHSRGGSGKMEDIDLNALIKEYVNLSFHGMRANKNPINVDIKVETDENLDMVKVNPENFSRVILNLCKNAFDAMREKLERNSNYLPTLIVRTRSGKEHVLIEIEDNGPGVPDEIKEKMMLPFFTTKKGSDGTGLGLSISQDIIKEHNGTLEIDSMEGEYTKFTILLNRKD